MSEEYDVIDERTPGGIRTRCGGTRTKVSTARPWQPAFPYNPDTCPFHNENDSFLITRHKSCGVNSTETWDVRGNKFTPHGHHRMILPETCWTTEKLYELGGPENLVDIISVALRVSEQNGAPERMHLGIHVGYLAGQNLGHQHTHLVDAQYGDEPVVDANDKLQTYAKDPKYGRRIIIDNSDYRVIAGGERGGMCYIVPIRPIRSYHTNPIVLADTILQMVALYRTRFTNTAPGKKGLPPEYILGLKLVRGEVKYGFYAPILNHFGFPHYFANLGEGTYILPWPHEKTAEHLLKED